uniref:Pro-cathepsin H-like n=1 Tax=Phallusia mammillata TaxID=59560 RepID=A0A6F9D9K2_9ASCI|nr:pro-cathepsin H-like [Phallusia mammillata]
MKLVLFTLCLCVFAVICLADNQPVLVFKKGINPREISAFKSWTVQQGMDYESLEDEQQKMEVFANNIRTIEEHNSKKEGTWKMEINKFSHLSFEEFSSLYLMLAQNCSATKGNHVISSKAAPPHKDWRDEGNFVTPVKNQKKCGSCWTFSTTGCMESATAIHVQGHPLYSLSEQQLVDCAQAYDDHGCEGGLPSHAFEYIRYNHGIMNESAYPYVAEDQKCKFQASKAVAFVKKVVNITQGAEGDIVDAVAFQNPVSIAFQVTPDFQGYKSGVYSNPTCGTKPDQVNHAVLVVGYGTDSATNMDYWLIKNSWGPDWGINGYFKMQKGVNMCGIATCASYPIVV